MPELPVSKAKTKAFNVRVSEEMYEKVKELAEKQGLTITQAVEFGMAAFIEAAQKKRK